MENSWGTRVGDLISLYSFETSVDAIETVCVRAVGGLDQGSIHSGGSKESSKSGCIFKVEPINMLRRWITDMRE